MAQDKLRRAGQRQSATYLKRLGQRIRGRRAQRGMTRRSLAHDSGVSLRFLAHLEGGSGNPSVLVLRQIASALSLPVEELVRDGGPRPVDHTLILQTLDRLADEELSEVLRLLTERFSRGRGEKENYISLIGLRGAGKSTLGQRLAEHNAIPFIELNREVEQEYGATVGEILALHGQPGYLRYERHCLEKVIAKHERAVIEIGGGLATDPETLALLLATTRTVWIRALPQEHMQRVIEQGDLRPMANSSEAMDDLRAILKARDPFYRKASLQLNTSGKSPTQSFRELLKLLKN
jgi:XRE family transcriptional regulator, aerobic/anaerobic benzoate catabolism transcriptional regulator